MGKVFFFENTGGIRKRFFGKGNGIFWPIQFVKNMCVSAGPIGGYTTGSSRFGAGSAATTTGYSSSAYPTTGRSRGWGYEQDTHL